MKNRKFTMIAFAIAISISFASCKKDPVVGPKGDKGDKGEQGETGNSNVKATVYNVPASNWTQLGTAGQAGYGFRAVLIAPDVTSAILERGNVSVDLVKNGTYINLPFTYADNGYQTIFEYAYKLNEVHVEIYDTDLLTLKPTETLTFKVVVTAGTQRTVNNQPVIERRVYSNK